MNRLIILLLAFLTLTGCRIRKSDTRDNRRVEKEYLIHNKDSTGVVAGAARTTQVSLSHQQAYEIELESYRDTLGTSQELTYYRIRDGDNEVIRVRNGRVRIRATNTQSNSLHKADTTLYKHSYTRAENEQKKHTAAHNKEAEKKTTTSLVGYTPLLLLIALLAYICWRFKLFRWNILTAFKSILKRF